MFLSLNPDEAIISDKNPELIHTYLQVQHCAELVHDATHRIENNRDNYYRIRSLDPLTLAPVDRAARFIFLNRFCFNGLYRTNKKGQFNVPYAPTKSGELPSIEVFLAVAERLKKATVLCCDFQDVLLSHAKQGDMVFLDPPYLSEQTRIFSQYGPDGFTLDDLERLKITMRELEKRSVDFVLSYTMEDYVVDEFSEWNQIEVTTKRNISGKSTHRKTVSEVLITNIEASHLMNKAG